MISMDKHFLEFWKDTFAGAARGVQQFETLAQWMDQGMKGVREITERFRKAYGLDRLPQDSSEEGKARWDRAVQDFQASYQKWVDGMGLVPKEKYAALLKKCEAQEKIIAEQKEELSRLRLQKQMEEADREVKGFVQLMESQAAQFQKTVEAVGTFMGHDKKQKK